MTNYDKDILKQLTRIANNLEKIEKKLPNASKVYFGTNLLGGLFVGVKNDNPVSIGEPMKEN